MFTAFYNGINGVKAQNFGIDSTSNNIANVNTPGYKYYIAEFSDVFNKVVTSQSSNPSQAGFGSVQGANKLVFEQGHFLDTGGEFDVALAGKGFFGVTSNDGIYYTRNGSFVRDANGNLVDSNGNYVLGTMNPNFSSITYSQRVSQIMGDINNTPVTSGFTINNPNVSFDLNSANAQGILSVPTNLYYQPQITTSVSFKGSLDSSTKTENVNVNINPNTLTMQEVNANIVVSGSISREDIFSAKEGERLVINFTDANGVKASAEVLLDENLNFRTNELELAGLDRASLSIDSAFLATQRQSADTQIMEEKLINADGSENRLRLTLERILPQEDTNIAYKASVQIFDTEGNALTEANEGRIVFDQAGAMIENTISSVQNPSNSNTININLGSTLNASIIGSGFDGLYININEPDVQNITSNQNGVAEGFFQMYDIKKDGSIMVQFSNGATATVAKLALYNFINEQGLASSDGSNFIQTGNSGEASFLYDEEGNFIYTAEFIGDKLEASSTDLGVELTNLIVMQKAFDASSKSITTSDQMIQQAINMKK